LLTNTTTCATPTWRASSTCSRVCSSGALRPVDEQDRAVHLRRAGDHVLHVVGVARAVDVRVVPRRRLVLDVREVDRDPAARSSGALSIWSNAMPCRRERGHDLVMAAVRVVLPWSTWPMVPTFICTLFMVILQLRYPGTRVPEPAARHARRRAAAMVREPSRAVLEVTVGRTNAPKTKNPSGLVGRGVRTRRTRLQRSGRRSFPRSRHTKPTRDSFESSLRESDESAKRNMGMTAL
jgi:hypothetical protein